ncbi:thioredoxin family protein [Ferrimonas balearica]|uniref:thioredoxin family protein n=1 Tax=Ferrimonas balearica TaxID=44012 RepID=UPI001C574873|nr:thioredoxin family protein [Ferrimonas balearica]MBW3138848.1 thioredoxin family protein [Ferrimonas balearica]MBY6105911.1 thioredoxin family protein [Ferrimonas balearica]
MKIEVLGAGCKKCSDVANQIAEVAQQRGAAIELVKVTDMARILDYQVMSTPAVVIDGVVKSTGVVPTADTIAQWLVEGQ